MRRPFVLIAGLLLTALSIAWYFLGLSSGVPIPHAVQPRASESSGAAEEVAPIDIDRAVAQVEMPDPNVSTSSVVIRCVREDGVLIAGAAVRVHDGSTGELLHDSHADESAMIEIVGPSRESVLIIGNAESEGLFYVGMLETAFPNGASQHELVLASDRCSLAVLVLAGGRPMPDLIASGSDGRQGYGQVTDLAGIAMFRNLTPGYMSLTIGPPRSPLAKEMVATKEGEMTLCTVHVGVGAVRVHLVSEADQFIPLEDFIVSLQPIPNDANSIDRQTQADANGVALFEHVQKGEYLTSIGFRRPLPEHASTLGLAASFARVVVGESQESVILQLVQSATVRIRVTGGKRNYAVPAGITYRLPDIGMMNNWRHPSTYSTSNEYQEFSVPPGEITIFAMNDRDGWGECRLHLLPGETQTCTIALKQSGPSLKVEVLGLGALSIDAVFIYDASDGLVLSKADRVSTASISEQGSIAQSEPSPHRHDLSNMNPGYATFIPALPVGEYRIVCTGGRRRIAEGRVTLVQDSVVTLFAESQ